MLIRPCDRSDDDSRWRAFVRSQGFGHLAACGVGRRYPVVVPTQFVLGDDHVELHLAAPNPVFDALAEQATAILSVSGDWAYIPGEWKALGDEDPALGIPTTYYGAVQLSGPVAIVDDPVGLAAILRRQLAFVEPDGGLVDPAMHEQKFPAIRGIRLGIDEVRAKFKYGGNVDAVHRASVARHLRSRAGPGDAAAADHIEL